MALDSSAPALPAPLTLLDNGESLAFVADQEIAVQDARIPADQTADLQTYAQDQGLQLLSDGDDLILFDQDSNSAIRIVGQLADTEEDPEDDQSAEATSLAGDGSGDGLLGGGAGVIATSAPGASLDDVAGPDGVSSMYDDTGVGASLQSLGFSALSALGGGEANASENAGTGNDSIYAGDGDDLVTGGAGNDLLSGGAGSDTLSGGDGEDSLYGGPGDDLLSGGAGNDLLSGGEGADTLLGGDGEDSLYGGPGNDLLSGGAGNDLLSGGEGADTLLGGDGNDTLYGGPGQDLLDGGLGDDLVYGNADADTLYGGDGNDTVFGGAGNDTLFGGDGGDSLHGGDGNDLLSGGGGADVLSGGDGTDTLLGGDANDTLYGGAGQDLLDGGLGDDLVYGNADADTLYGGAGNDTVFGGAGDDLLSGGEGTDLLVGGLGDDALHGGDGNDLLSGGEGADTLLGGDGGDLLSGGGGNDLLSGGEGDDTLSGGGGADTLSGGDGADVVSGGVGNDILLGNAGADLLDAGEGDDTLSGGDGADTLIGGAGADMLSGGTGDDVLSGGAGSDGLFGGAGNDLLSGGAGADVLSGGDGADTLDGGAGQDIVFGNAGDDVLASGDDADTLYGGDGNDLLSGGAGNDLLSGGEGADTLLGGDGGDQLAGGAGDDAVSGGLGDDTLVGQEGADVLSGGAGNDLLSGGGGDDSLYGGAGADTLDGGAGNDLLDGGAGNDVFVRTLGEAAGLDTIVGFTRGEDRIQLLGGDVLAAVEDALANQTLSGGGLDIEIGGEILRIDGVAEMLTTGDFGLSSFTIAADRTSAVEGSDSEIVYTVTRSGDTSSAASVTVVFGGTAVAGEHYADLGSVTVAFAAGETTKTVTVGLIDDQVIQPDRDVTATLTDAQGGLVDASGASVTTTIADDDSFGTPGDDTINGSADDDTLYGGDGNDVIAGSDGNDVIYGGSGTDSLSGGAGDDTIYGQDGDDLVSGGDGNDLLSGGAGDDSIAGGDGDDVIYGGPGNDTLNGDGGNDTLFGNDGDDLLEGGPGNDTLSGGAGNDTVIGNEGDDLLDGGDDNDTLSGGTGADTLLGRAGDDALDGGTGNDTLSGGAGADTVIGNDGNDLLDGGDGNDLLSGSEGADTLLGGDGEDSLVGGSGNDRISGGAGNDWLSGGAGEDTFYFADDGGNDTIADFQSGADRIAFSGTGVDALALSGFDNQRVVGDDVVFDVGSGTVTVAGRTTPLAAADFGLSTFELSNDLQATSEGDAAVVTYTITRGGATDRAASVTIGFGGNAIAGIDYAGTGAPIVVEFATGETVKTVTVQLLDDSESDGEKTLTASLSSAQGGVLTGAEAVATVVADDDLAVRLSDASLAMNEGAGTGTLTFELTAPVAAGDVVVRYEVLTAAGDTAIAGTDFVAIAAGEVSIPAGSLASTALLTLLDDSRYEGDETLTVRITEVLAPTGVSIGGGGTSSTVTIVDDDTPPILTLSGPDLMMEDGSIGSSTITIRKSGSTDAPAVARVISSDGALDQMITFAAGETEKTVLYSPADNADADGSRTVTISLVDVSGAIVAGSGSHTIQILDDETTNHIVHDGQGPDTITGTAGDDVIRVGSGTPVASINDITVLPLAGVDYIEMTAQSTVSDTTVTGASGEATVVHLATTAGDGAITGTSATTGAGDDSLQLTTTGGTLGHIGGATLVLGDGNNQVLTASQSISSAIAGTVAGRHSDVQVTAGSGVDHVRLLQKDLTATSGAGAGEMLSVELMLGDGDNTVEVSQLNILAGVSSSAITETGSAAVIDGLGITSGAGRDVVLTRQVGVTGFRSTLRSDGGAAGVATDIGLALGDGNDIWRHEVRNATAGHGGEENTGGSTGPGRGGDAGTVDGVVADLGDGIDQVEMVMSAIVGGAGGDANYTAQSAHPTPHAGASGGDAAVVRNADLDFGGDAIVRIDIQDARGGAGGDGAARSGRQGNDHSGDAGRAGIAGVVEGVSVSAAGAQSVSVRIADVVGGQAGRSAEDANAAGATSGLPAAGGIAGAVTGLAIAASGAEAAGDTIAISVERATGGKGSASRGGTVWFGQPVQKAGVGGEAATVTDLSVASGGGDDTLAISLMASSGGDGGDVTLLSNPPGDGNWRGRIGNGADAGKLDQTGATVDMGDGNDVVRIRIDDNRGGDVGQNASPGAVTTGDESGGPTHLGFVYLEGVGGSAGRMVGGDYRLGAGNDLMDISMSGNTAGAAANAAVISGAVFDLGAGNDRLTIDLGANMAHAAGSGWGNVISASTISAGAGDDVVRLVARGAVGSFSTANTIQSTTVDLGSGSDRLEVDAGWFAGLTVNGGNESAAHDTIAFVGETSVVDLRSGSTAPTLTSIEGIDLAADAGSHLTLNRATLLQTDPNGGGDHVLRVYGDTADTVVFDVGGAATLTEVGSIEEDGVTFRRFANTDGGSTAYLEVQQGVMVNPGGFERQEAFLGGLADGEAALAPLSAFGTVAGKPAVEDMPGMDARWEASEPVSVAVFFEPGRLGADQQASFDAAIDSWLQQFADATGLSFERYAPSAGDTMHDNGADIAVGIGRGYLAGMVGADQVGRYAGISLGIDPSQVGISLGNAGIGAGQYTTAAGDFFLHDGLSEIGLEPGSFGYYVIGQEIFHSLGGGELDDAALRSLGLDPAVAYQASVMDETVPDVTAKDFAQSLGDADLHVLQKLYAMSAEFQDVAPPRELEADDDHHPVASIA